MRQRPETDADQLFEHLVRTHGDVMYRVAIAIVQDHALAEDVTQDSLVKAWLAVDTFRGEGSMRGWLLRITHNTAVSLLRRQRDDAVDPAVLPERVDPRAENQAAAIHLRSSLESSLALLNPTSRAIVVLRDVDGYSYDEIRRDPSPQDAYGASKAALIRISKSLAIQFAADGIRSNVIIPGPALTPMQARWDDDTDARDRVSQAIPLGRLAESEDMADACVFLLSDNARYITGTELVVDGGLTALP